MHKVYDKRANARQHTVQKGDTLAKIAKRAGVPKLKLAEWNGLTPDTALTPGQALLVYPV